MCVFFSLSWQTSKKKEKIETKRIKGRVTITIENAKSMDGMMYVANEVSFSTVEKSSAEYRKEAFEWKFFLQIDDDVSVIFLLSLVSSSHIVTNARTCTKGHNFFHCALVITNCH